MPARPGQTFQRVLPGMGRVERKQPAPVTREVPAWNDRRKYTGPQPGQLVMGVTDLAHEQMSRSPFGGGDKKDGFMEVDHHGYVQEGTGTPMNDREAGDGAAFRMYATHGGRHARTVAEQAEANGESPSELGYSPSAVQAENKQGREVRDHWKRQPTVQFPTDALVHSTQSALGETEGDGEYATKRTAGGSPVMRTAYGGNRVEQQTEIPGSGEGRARIEKIKRDLEGGSQIKKPIWMVKANGRHFQLDGHHRMVAAREAGVSHVPVKMWDLDAARSTPPPAHVLDHAVANNPALAEHLQSGGNHASMFGALKRLAAR